MPAIEGAFKYWYTYKYSYRDKILLMCEPVLVCELLKVVRLCQPTKVYVHVTKRTRVLNFIDNNNNEYHT